MIRLRTEYPDVKVVALSGGGWTSKGVALEHMTDLGAVETIAKPFTAEEVVEVVESSARTERLVGEHDVGDEGCGLVGGRKKLRDEPGLLGKQLVVEPDPMLLGQKPAKDADHAGRSTRFGRIGPLENRPVSEPVVDVRAGGARIAVQAEMVTAKRVDRDEQDVACRRARFGRRRGLRIRARQAQTAGREQGRRSRPE